ncbi:MAG TPA: tRNA guanosine(15) transglycosylase TgtA, partial [Thermoprotei archaeon]|nr:tRNA guanosine(15) transglycosylase TgtA [Thermoprotei archaeon]
MSIFEIKEKDLLGRIGSLKTKHGTIETPAIAPVIHPIKNIIDPLTIVEKIGFNLVMTNSYIIWRRYGEVAVEIGLHNMLGIDKPIMTDSGAYQLMTYGKVEVSPKEILEYQVNLGSDIGVILDIPTRYQSPYDEVKREVDETIRRAKEAITLDREDMLLVGPVQGGKYTNLVAYSARQISTLDFDIYAIGGPTQIMENYLYDELVTLVMTAKMNLPICKPIHLFGAGNPIMIPLAVAMGMDLFDSASYILYAQKKRYMTPNKIYNFKNLK